MCSRNGSNTPAIFSVAQICLIQVITLVTRASEARYLVRYPTSYPIKYPARYLIRYQTGSRACSPCMSSATVLSARNAVTSSDRESTWKTMRITPRGTETSCSASLFITILTSDSSAATSHGEHRSERAALRRHAQPLPICIYTSCSTVLVLSVRKTA